ncbi:hypothetical protein [Enterobacter soli]|uniref:hypothetical protein n=1 Tax=Enterobacter soli TaxID=885040 RepID=UPI003ED9BFF2
MKDDLINSEEFTKEQLIEEAKQAVEGCHRLLRVSPDIEAHKISLRLAEIALATLTAAPVKYAANGSLFSQIGAAEVTARCYGVQVEPLYRSPIEGLK